MLLYVFTIAGDILKAAKASMIYFVTKILSMFTIFW